MLSLLLFFATPALATLNPDLSRGESIVQHIVPGRGAEVCIIPKHLSQGDYGKKDAEREAKLCGFDIGATVAACPKNYSTNPGVDFYRAPEGISVDQVAAKDCQVDGAKKEAKYKLSTSCSYTPAILAYYHFSRALGNIVHVPVAVIRTLDLKRHETIAQRALQITKRGDLISQTWKSLASALSAGSHGKRADLLFTDRYDQTYGALSRNPRGEEKYSEFFNGGVDRVAAFKAKNPIYRALTQPALKVSRDFNAANVQAMVQLRDASDWILLDTVLGQQDRIGNIHYENRYFYLADKNGEVKLKSEEDLKEVPEKFQAKAVKAKEMILKDNDCGVAKENRIKEGRLLEGVSHMDPKTYRRMLALAASIDGAEMKEFLSNEVLFTERDYNSVRANLIEAATLLQKKCRSGQLKLDLDLNAYFSGAELPAQYGCQ